MDESTPVKETESWSGVEAVANTSEAAIVVGFLQNHDIPARVVDRSFHQTPTTDEDLTPIEVAVPTELLEEARAALAKREQGLTGAPEDSIITDDGPRQSEPGSGGGGS